MIKMVDAALRNFFVVVLASCCVICFAIEGYIFGAIFGKPEELILLTKIFGIMLLSVWGVYVVVFIATYKTVIVTKDKIVLKKWGRELWSLNSNDLKECRCYYENIYIGVSKFRSMEFILKGIDDDCAMWKARKNYYFRCSIVLSVKNAKKMAEMGYNVNLG